MISKEECCSAIVSVVRYGVKCRLLDELDETYAKNTLLRMMGLDAFEPYGEEFSFPQCLELLCDYAVQNGMIENSILQRDLFDTMLMDVITPRPSQVIRTFRKLYAESSKASTGYFYKLSQDSNYIRRNRIAKDKT